jgi:hypothetical protein
MRKMTAEEGWLDLGRCSGQFEGMCWAIQGDMPLDSTGGPATLPLNETRFGQKSNPR